jgi:hypothetical protein
MAPSQSNGIGAFWQWVGNVQGYPSPPPYLFWGEENVKTKSTVRQKPVHKNLFANLRIKDKNHEPSSSGYRESSLYP